MIKYIKDKFTRWLNSSLLVESVQSDTGHTIDRDSIMQLSAVWACTRLISETIGTLPIHIYKRRPDGGRERDDMHALNNILKTRVNIETLASTYWQANIANMLLSGNCISRKLLYNKQLVGLRIISPEYLSVKRENGRIVYYERDDDNKLFKIPDDEVFKTTGFSLDGVWGCSVIEYGASVFGSALGASVSANQTFKNGLMPTTVFSTDRVLTNKQREEMRESVNGMSSTLQAGRSLFLEAGFKGSTLSVNPRDAQLLESRGFSVEEICRMFGVDPSMIGHGKSVSNWGTGLEQKMTTFLVFTLRSWITRLEQAINAQLMPIQDQQTHFAEYNVEGLLRADSAQRAQYLRTMTDAGIMTRDEARMKENLPTMGGNAAVLMINSASQPIDSLGENQNDTCTYNE